MRRHIEDRASEAGYTVWYAFLAVVAIVVLVGGLYLFYPAALGFERQAVTHSNSYVQSRQEELVRLQASHDHLDAEARQARSNGDQESASEYAKQEQAVEVQMRQIEATLPSGTIPAGVTVR